MKKLWLLFVPMALFANSMKDDVKLIIDAESTTPIQGVKRISPSIRQKDGKFGKAFLIERRTLNLANPKDLVLGDGATVSPKGNVVKLPENGFVALPLPKINPKSINCLSFECSGSGEVTITLDEGGKSKVLKTIKATTDKKLEEVKIIPTTNCATIKIRSTDKVTLDKLMFDKNISFANSYHEPGRIRGVDIIELVPDIWNNKSGSISFWVKCKWLNSENYANANGFLGVSSVDAPKWKTIKSITVWNNIIHFSNKSEKPYKGIDNSFKKDEIKDISNDNWEHFVFNWEEKDGKLYLETIVNGNQRFTNLGNFKTMPDAKRVTIGYIAGAYLNGMIDDIAIFKRPLTLKEANEIVNCAKPIKELLGINK